ncbi:MAG: hypothetical protein EA389_15040 [Ilumatobacter sp.]|nr:MAG: hypothetical protein EA389_15040 [Ilumatobacter sp.]
MGDTSAVSSITNTVATCEGAPSDDEPVPDTVGSGLTHLGDGNWQFNWKTNRGWSGSCRNLRVRLTGAPTLEAVTFDFR